MNLHAAQSSLASIEVAEIANVPSQIISPAKSVPIISVAQDSMVGSYILTNKDFVCTGEELFNFLMNTTQLKSNFNPIEARKKEKWSGKELFSTILPNISLKKGSVLIKNGELLEGRLGSGVLGGSAGGLVQLIFKQYGPIVCRDFLDNLQRLVIRWLENNGFTIGLGDSIPPKELKEKIKGVLNNMTLEVEELIARARQGIYEPHLRPKLRMIKLENEIMNIMNRANSKSEDIIHKNLPKNNNFKISIDSGSKGKKVNINQIEALIGQQSIDGKRVPYGFTGRTLPHFAREDYGPASRGFCYSSFIEGMRPHEFFFSAMAARNGSINTHIKTSDTGYIQRRMIKLMEDVRVAYDGTVRNAKNKIIQFLYGRNNFDPTKLEVTNLSIMEKNNYDLKKEYYWTVDDLLPNVFRKETFDKIKKEQKEQDKVLEEEWKQLVQDRKDLREKYFPHLNQMVSAVFMPIHLPNFITSKKYQFNIQEYGVTDLDPKYAIEQIKELNKFVVEYLYDKKSLPLLKIYIRSHLSSKQCIQKHRFTKMIFDHTLAEIKDRILRSFISPGEMVGVVAAQSIGEPLTQITLSTFHFSGIGSKAVLTTSGVGRVKEIINNSKDIKTPSMTIYLKPQYSQNKEIALAVKNDLEYTTINDVLLESQIIYLPEIGKGKYPEDEEVYKVSQEISRLMETQCLDREFLSNWVLYMEFNKDVMAQKKIYIRDVHEAIIRNYDVDTDIHCVVSDMNSDHVTMRIRVRQDLVTGKDYITHLREMGDKILQFPLRGIPGIRKVGMSNQEWKVVYQPDGGYKCVQEWVLNTDGSNIIEVFSNQFVDTVRSTTNDIAEIKEVFGIDAAREAIIREMKETISGGGGSRINHSHFAMLADSMCYRGFVMQVSRHGFGKSPDIGVIGRASFEVMCKMLIRAGAYAQQDDMNGTSANILMGQPIHGGTNSFDLLMNEDMFPEEETERKEIVLSPLEKTELKQTPTMAPLEDTEAFDFEDDFKLDSTREQKLDNFVRLAQANTSRVSQDQFSFGFDIETTEQYRLPHLEILPTKIKFVKGAATVSNRKRRNRK